jgi:signal recognition particle subunit SRP54
MFDFLTQKFSSVFSSLTGQKYLTEENIDQSLTKVHDALIEADVPYGVIQAFISQVKQEVIGQKVLSSLNPGEQFIKVIHDKMVTFLGGSQNSFNVRFPAVIVFMGLQGSGKTTTIAKLAYYLHENAKQTKTKCSMVCASVDFTRPAAREQLEILAKKVGITYYNPTSSDPVRAAGECFEYYKRTKSDVLLLDTAGRLHVDGALLEELRAIDSVIQAQQKILVLDAMTGQESLRVAQAFEQAVGFNGAILTKLDSDTRAGAAFAFAYQVKKPIWFLGSGEKHEDLDHFKPDRIASRIIGMGDIQTLLEHAQRKIAQKEQEDAQKAFDKGILTLEDFAKQLDMVNKLGSFSQLLKYMPGMGGMNLSPDMISKGEAQVKQFKAIIGSMTPKERLNPTLLNGSRKQRIAKGAGVQVSQVNLLLDRFEQTQQFVKLLKKSGKFPRF